ncbi:MAG: MOSC domain-containing protein [Cyanobacteria bacterium P01_A01_bin.40]
MTGEVIAVCLNTSHVFSKLTQDSIKLLSGMGVAGDAHCGVTVKHRSRIEKNPHQPNLRQVHLIHAELHDELNNAGFDISPGQMGENITTRGIDLLSLPTDTRLYIGNEAVIQVIGLRNPCGQLNSIQAGLKAAVLDKDTEGNIIRKAGIMSIVLTTGEIFVGDTIQIEFPPLPHRALEKV